MNDVTSETFTNEVLKSENPVIVDFWAPWCGPCRQLAPVYERLAAVNKQVKFCKLNVDENQDISGEYGIMAIPCVVAFKDGKEVNRLVGNVGEQKLQQMISHI